jgi:hypothetical protein
VVSLTEALAAERENLERNSAENEARREVSREVLEVLFERLTLEALLGWSFVLKKDEIVVSHMKAGLDSGQSIGSWVVDQDLCLQFAGETTEWITPESVGRVLDEAVRITARRIVDVEEQVRGASRVASVARR